MSAKAPIWLYRVQDKAGRGPFKPGMSKRWVEDTSSAIPPPIVGDEFPGIYDGAHKIVAGRGGAVGCGCRDKETMARWFTPTERGRLRALGYRLVRMAVDEIIEESANQSVFWRKRPFRVDCLVIPWSDLP